VLDSFTPCSLDRSDCLPPPHSSLFNSHSPGVYCISLGRGRRALHLVKINRRLLFCDAGWKNRNGVVLCSLRLGTRKVVSQPRSVSTPDSWSEASKQSSSFMSRCKASPYYHTIPSAVFSSDQYVSYLPYTIGQYPCLI
jgi:hypothetical protein